MFYEQKDNKIILRLKVQPNANKSAFFQPYGDVIKVRIKAPAVEGAANKELIKFLSKSFKVPKSDIILKTGQHSKVKIVEFPQSDRFDDWIEQSGYR
ncbi:MAG: YggU family protein [Sulfurovum sp.]|nr:MAG: YggU family protein [Sulfurovum sp.]